MSRVWLETDTAQLFFQLVDQRNRRNVDRVEQVRRRLGYHVHGIMSRSLAPTFSMSCSAWIFRVALNEGWPTLHSWIQSVVNLPVWMSFRMAFSYLRVSSVMVRGPVT